MERLTQSIRYIFNFVLLVAMCLSTARAQDSGGRIIGNITDQAKGVVAGANVTVTNEGTMKSDRTVTNAEGFYQVLALPIGSYSVTIEVAGFEKQVFEHQGLEINQTRRVDAQLKVGVVTESVIVTEQPVAIETVNQTIGGTIIGAAIQEAPLNGRDVLQLALLQPGVTETNPDNQSQGAFSIAGGRTDSVTFLLDGAENNNLLNNGVVFNPNPDAIAEFRILESNYSAEYGRNSGGIVSVVTKSGTNVYHGTVYDYLRNDAFNANTFFNNEQGIPRNILKRNQFGGTLGGPLSVPHLVNGKDRFFFFVSYQGQRLSEQETTIPSQTRVFTKAELGGDFSKSGPNGTPDPNVVCFLTGFLPGGVTPCGSTAQSFFQSNSQMAAQGILDPTKFNPASMKYIAAGLIPSTTNADGLVTPVGSHIDNRNELTMKFDFQITEKDKLTATIGGFRNPVLDPFITPASPVAFANVAGYGVNENYNSYLVNLAYSRTINSGMLNELRFFTQRQHTTQGVPSTQLPTASQLGIAITPDNPSGPPLLQFDTGLETGFSYQGPTTLVNNTFGATDTFSWIHGRHNLKFGGGISSYQNNEVYDFIVNGVFTFIGAGGTGTGNSFADFLLGLPNNYQQGPAAPSNIRTKSFYGFAQDEWRVARRLTLTLGLRYEYNSPKYDTEGRTFSIIPGLQSSIFTNAPPGLVFPGDQGAPRGVNFPVKNNWAPRFGFAWDPRGDGKTSLRGGIGVFYDILKAEDNFQFNGQAPFFSGAFFGFNSLPPGQSSIVTNFSDPFGSIGIPNTFPSTPPPSTLDFSPYLPFGAGSLFFVDPHLRTPYTYQYNLSLQRQLTSNLSLELGYLGSSSHGLTSLQDVNPFILGTTNRVLNKGAGDSTCADETGGNINLSGCSFAGISEFKNVANATYNGLDVNLQEQLHKSDRFGGVYFTLGYTYSHGIDNASGFNQRNRNVPSYDPGLFRASSDMDLRHRFTFSGNWDLPFGHMWRGGPKRLTEGWSLFPIISWRSGFPLDIFADLPDRNLAGTEGPSGAGDPQVVHANVVGPTNTKNPRANGNLWFNPTSFSNARCFDPLNPPPCTPGPGLFPADSQVVANPALATYGSLPRNFLRGPGRFNFDLTVAKSIAITERMKLQFQADIFNVFNQAEFLNPDTTITDPTFGQITNTSDPRIIQLAARFSF
ncbi:MAG TPA: TonB-dependent receptor [Candidatus Saccharimonadales bacterium]|jgi:outer membrane receptor protein involved in Fe transport|nr:TonB-dependent receptor [Candidatus Saccharimonadales bacterium]